MQRAIVTGRATTTVRHDTLAGQKLLVCQPLGADGRPHGDPLLVVDQLGAGSGDHVVVTSDGLGIMDMLGDNNTPANHWTLGIID